MFVLSDIHLDQPGPGAEHCLDCRQIARADHLGRGTVMPST